MLSVFSQHLCSAVTKNNDQVPSSQRETCFVLGSECCTHVLEPTDNLRYLQNGLANIRTQLQSVTKNGRTWFEGIFGTLWK